MLMNIPRDALDASLDQLRARHPDGSSIVVGEIPYKDLLDDVVMGIVLATHYRARLQKVAVLAQKYENIDTGDADVQLTTGELEEFNMSDAYALLRAVKDAV